MTRGVYTRRAFPKCQAYNRVHAARHECETQGNILDRDTNSPMPVNVVTISKSVKTTIEGLGSEMDC